VWFLRNEANWTLHRPFYETKPNRVSYSYFCETNFSAAGEMKKRTQNRRCELASLKFANEMNAPDQAIRETKLDFTAEELGSRGRYLVTNRL
jgi:hypothetical protein